MQTFNAPHLTNFSQYGFIHRVFQCLRIIGKTQKTLSRKVSDFAILLCIFLICVDRIITGVLQTRNLDFKIRIPCFLGYTSSVVTLSILFYKRRRITKLVNATVFLCQQKNFVKSDLGVILL